LERIESALRHPAKVRAAERLVDAGKLLDQRRFDRALPLAQEAISDDPLNSEAFGAAAWALLGLGRLEESHDHFVEAATASAGTDEASYTRRAARVAFALGRAPEAEAALRNVLANSSPAAFEQAACSYDLAIYVAEHNLDEATENLRHATSYDSRYAAWALADPLIHAHPELLNLAVADLEAVKHIFEQARGRLQTCIATAEDRLAQPINIPLSSRSELAKTLRRATEFAETDESRQPVPAGAPEVGFTVVLKDVGAHQVAVIRAVMGITGLDLAEAKLLVDGAPTSIRERLSRDQAEEATGLLEAAGATVAGLEEPAPRPPFQGQVAHITYHTDKLDRAVDEVDEQMQALPRIRELLALLERLYSDLDSRKGELKQLDSELYEAYRAGMQHTQELTNALGKYRGRKRKRKLKERDEASKTHLAAQDEWMKVRGRAIGRDTDPESAEIFAAIGRAQSELSNLNPGVSLPTRS
jgi:ribosomal protein L7/L12